MYRTIQQNLVAAIQHLLAESYNLHLPHIPVEQPPNIALGELSTPIAFELAKRLRKAPRILAAELAENLTAAIAAGRLPGIASVELAGAGYLNLRFDRLAVLRDIAADRHADVGGPGFRLVEHTSINPNKAAHIGHLRNAILGDTFARLLRPDAYKSGYEIGVQNYVDNTGVQVADVVVGLVHLEGMDLDRVRELLTELLETNQRIDFYCWDLYARVSQWYTADPDQLAARKQIRLDTLHALEAGVDLPSGDDLTDGKDPAGANHIATIADLIATAVLRRHLESMERLGIQYDFLPRESEILSLHFWDAARSLMIDRGVLYLESEGKNRGCYVMRRAGNPDRSAPATPAPIQPPAGQGTSPHPTSPDATAPNPTSPDSAAPDAPGPDEDAKVIVRSNGTVTYVGKDIAYHLWKFGLLPGKDFGYRRFHEYLSATLQPSTGQPPIADQLPPLRPHTCWISTADRDPAGEHPHPSLGHADAIYNVIDSRQNDPQSNVVAALRGMGFTAQADAYTHLSYEMVALTPRCAIDLGYTVSQEDRARPYLEVSGRKGFGVKADDLIDQLIAAARTEVDNRHPELPDADRLLTATQIAVGALRFFMLRFTRNTVIAFDFRDALSFEGETGPYIQYAIVRAANILRKAGATPQATLENLLALTASPSSATPASSTRTSSEASPTSALANLISAEDGTGIWETWLLSSRLTSVLDGAITAAEPAILARYSFQLAQQFNNFYHRHHVLNETDPTRRTLLLATAAIAARELTRALAYLGIQAPAVM